MFLLEKSKDKTIKQYEVMIIILFLKKINMNFNIKKGIKVHIALNIQFLQIFYQSYKLNTKQYNNIKYQTF